MANYWSVHFHASHYMPLGGGGGRPSALLLSSNQCLNRVWCCGGGGRAARVCMCARGRVCVNERAPAGRLLFVRDERAGGLVD
jgi:hypothetical protein